MNARRGVSRLFVVLWVGWAGLLGYVAFSQPDEIDPEWEPSWSVPVYDTTSWFAEIRRLPEARDTLEGSERHDANRLEKLGREVKAKYPLAYDDLTDYELGDRFEQRHPGSYAWFQRQEAIGDSIVRYWERRKVMERWGSWAGLGILAPGLILGAIRWVWAGFTSAARLAR